MSMWTRAGVSARGTRGLTPSTPCVLEAAARFVRGCSPMCGPCVLEAAAHGLTSSTAVPSTRSAPPSSSSSPRTPGRVRLQPGRVGLQPGRVGLQPGEVGLQQQRSVGVVAHAAQFDEREAERAGSVRRPAREEPRSLAAEPRGVHLGLDCLEAEAVRGRDAQRPAPSGVHRGATQPLMHRVAASVAHGCSLWCTGGCSL